MESPLVLLVRVAFRGHLQDRELNSNTTWDEGS